MITGLDVDSVYAIPVVFNAEGILKTINSKLHIAAKPNLKKWSQLVYTMTGKKDFKKEINIAICGKYTRLEDSYASVVEAIKHCQAYFNCKINIKWIETTDCNNSNISTLLLGIDGVIVPGGFGDRGVEGKICVIKYARENNIPFLGLCYGLQLAVVEFARTVCGLKDAHTTECNPKTKNPVIDILPEQRAILEKGGTMRLGAYTAYIKDYTKVYSLYRMRAVSERHRHRYEVNPAFHEILQKHGLVFSGLSKDKTLVEFIELRHHPYFVATQAHPELKSSLLYPAPLFKGLIGAALHKEHNE